MKEELYYIQCVACGQLMTDEMSTVICSQCQQQVANSQSKSNQMNNIQQKNIKKLTINGVG